MVSTNSDLELWKKGEDGAIFFWGGEKKKKTKQQNSFCATLDRVLLKLQLGECQGKTICGCAHQDVLSKSPQLT